MNTKHCRTCSKVMFGGADNCSSCRQRLRNRKQIEFNRRKTQSRLNPLDLSKIPEHQRKFVERLFAKQEYR